jgi:pimeloyl-ACP methyl ester carboxylesterase
LSQERQDFVATEEAGENTSHHVPAANGVIEERWMEIDGARMRYLHAGSGPPLILLHGLLGYSFSWRYAMPALGRYASVYAPDMLGAGFSDRAPGVDYSMRATGRRVLQFIENLGVSSFDLLGTSHGGAVAMMAAAECQGPKSRLHVQRLILVAPVNPFSPHGRWLAPFFGSAIGAPLFRFGMRYMPWLHSYFHARLYADRVKIPPGSLEGYKAPLAIPGLFEYAIKIAGTWTKDLRELKEILPKLASIPTLLVWGREDPAVYASSAEPLAKYFLNSHTVIYPGIGHLPYEECVEEFNRTLIQFLDEKELSA